MLPPSPPPVMMLPPLTERKKMLSPSPPPSMGRGGGCRPRCLHRLLPGVGLLPLPARSGRCAFIFAVLLAYRNARPARRQPAGVARCVTSAFGRLRRAEDIHFNKAEPRVKGPFFSL